MIIMSDQTRLNVRIRAIQLSGLVFFAVTCVVWFALSELRHITAGLLMGELGGAYVVYSMIRQGHRNDNLQGAALFASGIIGMITRVAVLAVVIIATLKLRDNIVAALAGYVLGYVFVFAGFAGLMRNSGTSTKGK